MLPLARSLATTAVSFPVLLSAGCTDLKAKWRWEGRNAAERDIAQGRLCLKTYGLPSPWTAKYQEMARTKGKTIDSITFVWMQGEADAKRGGATVYEESLRGLIKQFRDDLKRPDLTVVIGRLSEFKSGDAGWDAVRVAQVKVAEADPLAGWVDTDRINDGKAALHYTPKGYAEMGRRFAARSIELSKKKSP